MSVEEKNIIDMVGTAKNGEVHLTISDHLPWDIDNEHLLILQDKINSYLSFIESGQILKDYPTAKGKPIIIQIVLQFAPIGDAPTFLNRCKDTVEKAGYGFDWETMDFTEGSTNE